MEASTACTAARREGDGYSQQNSLSNFGRWSSKEVFCSSRRAGVETEQAHSRKKEEQKPVCSKFRLQK